MSFTYLNPNNYQSSSYTSSYRRSQSINSNKNPQLINNTYQKNINNNQNDNNRKSIQQNNIQSNKTYHERKISSSRQQNPSMKLTQMSSDLARLKQQLNKIMNQADKFSNNNINTASYAQKNIPKHQFNHNYQQTTKNYSNNHQQTTKNFNNNNNTYNNNNNYNTNYNTSYLNSSKQLSKTPAQKTSQQIFNFDVYSTSKTPKIVNNSFSQKNIITYGVINDKKNQQDNLNDSINKLQNKSYTNNKIDNLNFMNYKPILKIKQQLNKIQPKKQQSTKIQNQINKVSSNQINKVSSSNYLQKVQLQPSTYNQKISQQNSNNYLESSKRSYKPFQSIINDSHNNNSYINSINNSLKTIDNTQNMINQSINNNKAYSIENKIINSQYNKQISSIKKYDEQSSQVIQIKSNYLDLTKKYSQNSQSQRRKSNLFKESFQFQQKIIQLQHDKRKMKHQINNLLLQKQNYQIMLNTEKTQKQNILKKYNQIQLSLKQNKLQLQQYRDKCKLLQRKLQMQLSRKSQKHINKIQNSFDEVLKDQITQINKYKQKLQQKDEQIMRIKQLNTHHRRQIDSLNNQIKIQQLKGTSLLKQANQKHSIVLQDKQNQLKTYKNLILTLQAKLQVAIKQNKTKDNFMVQHLTGKVKLGEQKQYVQKFFKKYVIQFPVNRISQKLKQEQKQIEKLKQTIFQLASKQL